MQHTLSPFLIRAPSKTEDGVKEKRRGKRKVRKKTTHWAARGRNLRGKRGERGSLHWFLGSLASVQIPPPSQNKIPTAVSEPVRYARRGREHTHPTQSHVKVTRIQTLVDIYGEKMQQNVCVKSKSSWLRTDSNATKKKGFDAFQRQTRYFAPSQKINTITYT